VEQGRTLVIGVGEVGGALAQVLERSMPVLRLDLDPAQVDGPIGVMHICFPFVQPDGFKHAVAEYVKRFHPALTIINSTVTPGTTRAIAQACNAPIVFSPVRGKHYRMQSDLLRYDKFVAATDALAAQQAAEYFERAGMKTRRLQRPETLELAKLAETSYFGLLIAFAQELNRFADHVGGSYQEAATFFEEVEFLPRWNYFPGFIGGHCVIPNLRLLAQVRQCNLFDAIVNSNDRRALELSAADDDKKREDGSL
jgi:UDP-glucose 6-dehydrogenase